MDLKVDSVFKVFPYYFSTCWHYLKYPEYGFKDNKGYGSAKHIEALKKFGKTPIHRNTFIKNFI